MGVTGLWSIVQPCARPTKLETLNRKRLAVDASIWIYQFLKAVRDKEGNALRNSHVVGFFRRICKLLFFGIKPVFVFDGGAPALKRSVIRARKQRREGRRDDAARTAGKLLAVQMQRRAEEAEMRRKEERDRPAVVEEDVVPENEMVYVDELQMSAQERQQNRKFRKKDAYHLPDLDVSMNEMGGPNDMRVMSLEELQAYAKQFEAGEDINVYDFSKIDYDSPFFTSLPASDRYNILNAARLRSRLRMGHSKEQLDTMFPDRMAFSKFQIERVTERNELTQRLMHINGGDDAAFGANGMGRIAGEKGREYVLVKNDGVEGGWALGVVSNEGTSANEAIDVDRPVPAAKDESESDDDFVDVPVEGLNRLPRQKMPQPASAGNDLSRQRRAFYTSRRSGAKRKPKRPAAQEDPDSLFVAEQPSDEGDVEEWEEVDGNGDNGAADEDEELNRAIALSLQRDEPPSSPSASEEEQEDRLSIFQQSAVSESKAIPKGSGRAIANLVNKRAHEVAPESREVTSFGVPAPRDDSESSDEGDAMDLQAALAESRRTKRRTSPPGPRYNNALPHSPSKTRKPVEDTAANVAKKAGFSGPLPFEKLDLGSSLLGKKKMQQRTEEAMGGFEKGGEGGVEKKKPAEPLPPWFTGDVEEDMRKQKGIEDEDRRRAREYESQFQFQKRGDGGLMARNGGRKGEVIDLEAEETHGAKHGEVIDLEADDSDVAGEGELIDLAPASVREDDKLVYEQTLGEVAEDVRADPPTPGEEDHRQLPPPKTAPKGPFEVDEESEEEGAVTDPPPEGQSNGNDPSRTEQGEDETAPMSPDGLDAALQGSSTTKDAPPARNEANDEEDEEMIAWSESEDEATKASKRLRAKDAEPVGGALKAAETGSDEEFQDVDMAAQRPAVPRDEQEDEFEDVDMAAKPAGLLPNEAAAPEFEFEDVAEPVENPSFPVATSLPDQEGGVEDYDDFSDPEDVEIMRALAQEAEEHARFASSLNNNQQNNKPSAQAIADYEAELKQLRNQQKKDRRDADEVTHIMITECQQLLRLFGLPYITAPMEAEAQCAELVSLGLVDGIVTDDSDCFLFGGTRIYKNFFNQGKFVECYLSSDLEKEFALTRDKLIAVAQLLGSDYTEGLPGVGPVTALEILAEFGDLDGFKAWWTGVQDQSIPKAVDATSPFRKKFRKNATKIFLPPSFPDSRVASAYTEPEVESDKQAFEWGVPDLDALRAFLMATIGWTQERTDEVLVPVIRDMNRRIDEGTQANITQFFQGGVGAGAAAGRKGGEGWAPRKRADQAGSKRLGGALRRMAERADGKGEVADPSADARDAHDGGEATAAKPKGRKRKQDDVTPEEDSGDEDEDGSDFEAPKRKTRKARGGAKAAARGRGKGTKKAVAAATAEE